MHKQVQQSPVSWLPCCLPSRQHVLPYRVIGGLDGMSTSPAEHSMSGEQDDLFMAAKLLVKELEDDQPDGSRHVIAVP